MNAGSSKHSSFAVQNNLNGDIILAKRIVSVANNNIDNIVISTESTDIYGDNLTNFYVMKNHF